MDSQYYLLVGEVAKKSDLPVKTVRYYADLALLSPHIYRSENGYRLFSPEVLSRLSFIRRSQSLGLTLEEIKQILSVYDQGKIPCGVAKNLLKEKLTKVEEKIRELTLLKSELEGILSGWQDLPSKEMLNDSICPNIKPFHS